MKNKFYLIFCFLFISQYSLANCLEPYENLNNFLVKEWDILQENENLENEFTDDEEDMIIRDAMDILLNKLNVDEDDFEEHEQDVDWRRFDDIIGHYTCIM